VRERGREAGVQRLVKMHTEFEVSERGREERERVVEKRAEETPFIAYLSVKSEVGKRGR
jgi:hypothetical protein